MISNFNDDGNFIRRISEDQLLLLDINVSSVADSQLGYALFGDYITYKGYPSESGKRDFDRFLYPQWPSMQM